MSYFQKIQKVFSWFFFALLILIGILNAIYVHPVPAIAYFIISVIYLPPFNSFIQSKWSFSIPILIKIVLAILILMFTLGVSDLGDMIDKL